MGRRRRAAPAWAENEKTRIVRLNTDEVCGGMIAARHQQDDALFELAGSIARRGLLQPVVVSVCAGRYMLVCGARRLAACRLLGMNQIDAVVIRADYRQMAACFAEEHDTHRPPHFLKTAEMIRFAGASSVLSVMAAGSGRAARALALLGLSPQVRSLLLRRRLSLEQAEPLLSVSAEERQMEAACVIAERGLSPAQAARLCHVHAQEGVQQEEKTLLQEVARMTRRLRGMGMDTSVSAEATEGGLCVRLLLRSKQKRPLVQEKPQDSAN